MSISVVRTKSLPSGNIAKEFVGDEHGVSITVLLVDADPGHAVSLHKQAYDEVILILEGEATVDHGVRTRVVGAGDIVVIPAGRPHGFSNTGHGPLKQIDILASSRFATEWPLT